MLLLFCDLKVNKLNPCDSTGIVQADKNIAWLHIAVDYPSFGSVRKTVCDLTHYH